MEQNRQALVAGGTGLVGSHLLSLLNDDPRYNGVTSLVRGEAPTVGRVINQVISFSDLKGTILSPADDAYCCLGTTRKAAGSAEGVRKVDLEYVLAFAKAARIAGATRLLLISSIGADVTSRFQYTRLKGEAEAGVGAVGFTVVGIARPSFLMGRRPVARPGESLAILFGRMISPFMVGPLKRVRPIEASAVAAGLIRMAFTARPGVTVLSSKDLSDSWQARTESITAGGLDY